MKIAEVCWTDISGYDNKNAFAENDDPLIHMVSFGIMVGKLKDRHGMEYIKLCHKVSSDSHNDDFVVIPIGCIKRIKYHK